MKQIMPPEYFGTKPVIEWDEMQWINLLPKNTYFALWLKNPVRRDLPSGYDLYLIAFLDEPVDVDWLAKQVAKISQPIVVLDDGDFYDFPLPNNVHCFQYHSWHYQIDKIISWFPVQQPRDIKFKASAVCNRITQSKMIIFTALMEFLKQKELLVKLSNWIEEENVHSQQPTGIAELDKLSNIFYKKYLGTTISVDDFSDKHNHPRINSNPWQSFYLNSAIHFTNESYHYSYMIDGHGCYTRPGPYLSEKTHKCLISGTPFVSVAQFDVYRSLENLGFRFDYGPLNLDWDSDAGNLSRMMGIIDLIKQLSQYSISDIVDFTKYSSNHNADHIWSGKFFKQCCLGNEQTADLVLKMFK